MDRNENEAFVRNLFNRIKENHTELVARFVDDKVTVEEVLSEASKTFESMIANMAYVDTPQHPMATSVFFCNTSLAVYLALKTHGVSAHDYGQAMLTEMVHTPAPKQPENTETPQEQFQKFMEAAALSKQQAKPNEFVYEVFLGDDDDTDWGMNVKSCAICASFAQYDAMDLVPYMCATDDVMSDKGKDGLRRTGTIALSAHQCDFRYKKGGKPQPIAEAYPDRIRLTTL